MFFPNMISVNVDNEILISKSVVLLLALLLCFQPITIGPGPGPGHALCCPPPPPLYAIFASACSFQPRPLMSAASDMSLPDMISEGPS